VASSIRSEPLMVTSSCSTSCTTIDLLKPCPRIANAASLQQPRWPCLGVQQPPPPSASPPDRTDTHRPSSVSVGPHGCACRATSTDAGLSEASVRGSLAATSRSPLPRETKDCPHQGRDHRLIRSFDSETRQLTSSECCMQPRGHLLQARPPL